MLMEAFYKLFIRLLMIAISATIFMYCWNYVAPTHLSALPIAWQSLTWLQAFCLLFILRIITGIVRFEMPESVKVKE